MKKIIICLIAVLAVVLAIFFNWYSVEMQAAKEVQSFNSTFKQYTSDSITGVDVTTVINKAIDNNEKHNISKNDDNLYKNDGKYSIEICVKLELESKNYYPMESLSQIGMADFTKAYSTSVFKVSHIEYHENGRISRIDFEILELN